MAGTASVTIWKFSADGMPVGRDTTRIRSLFNFFNFSSCFPRIKKPSSYPAKRRRLHARQYILVPPKRPQIDTVKAVSDLPDVRSEEHTSELQSLMRISYAVFCLKKKKHKLKIHITTNTK